MCVRVSGLGSEKDRRKENDMPASKWSQKPLTSQASKSHVKAQKQLLKRYAHMTACRPPYSTSPVG